MTISRKKTLFSLFAMVGIALLGAGLLFSGTRGAMVNAQEEPAVEKKIPVRVTALASRHFELRLTVQGNIESANPVVVPALVGGAVEAMFVDEGDIVVAGETKLCQIDSLKLGKALDVRKQGLEVARLSTIEKRALLDSAAADQEKAAMDIKRFERLFSTGAVAKDTLEQQNARYKQSSAMLKHAQTLVDLALEQEHQADAAVTMSEKDLADTLLIAPSSGRISMKYLEVGEMAESAKPVFKIDDVTNLEVSVLLPAQHYGQVKTGETRMRIQSSGVDAGEWPVSYKSPTINPALRTFEAKCVLQSPPEGLAPGGMAEVAVLLAKSESLGVPSATLQIRDGKSILFVVDGDKARMVMVTPGVETDGWISVVGDGLAEGAQAVTDGQFLLNDGQTLNILEGNS